MGHRSTQINTDKRIGKQACGNKDRIALMLEVYLARRASEWIVSFRVFFRKETIYKSVKICADLCPKNIKYFSPSERINYSRKIYEKSEITINQMHLVSSLSVLTVVH
jgi:hypothetical protein